MNQSSKPHVRQIVLLALAVVAIGTLPVHAQKLLAEGVQDLATQIAANVTKERKQKIAVLPFRELDGKPTILSAYISEELVTDLFVIGGVEIVERALLDRLLGELELGQTGLIDQETAKEVGRVAGVDAIVTGTITDLQSYVALNCRLMDAQTGRIFAAAQTKIIKDDDVRKIMAAALSPPEGSTRSPSQPEIDADPSSDVGKPVQQQQADGFLFDLRSCTVAGSSIECELTITNRGEDRTLYASPYQSRLFDDSGNEYFSTAVSIGSAGAKGARRVRPSSLVSGVPVRARVIFEGVPSETSHATLFELVTQNFRVQFRDLGLDHR